MGNVWIDFLFLSISTISFVGLGLAFRRAVVVRRLGLVGIMIVYLVVAAVTEVVYDFGFTWTYLLVTPILATACGLILGVTNSTVS